MADYHFTKQLENNLEALPLLVEEIELFAQKAEWPNTVAMQINLVIEELFVNTINYGYSNSRIGTITIFIQSDSKKIIIEIRDDGDAFNPLNNKLPDTSLEIEDRPIGGLGIFLVKTYMDTFEYSYIDGQNVVSLSKGL